MAVCSVDRQFIIKKLPRTKNVVRKQTSNVEGRFREMFRPRGRFQEQKRKVRT